MKIDLQDFINQYLLFFQIKNIFFQSIEISFGQLYFKNIIMVSFIQK